MSTFFSYLKNHKFLVLVVVALGVFGYMYSNREVAPKYETTTVKRGNVLQEVSVTGRVESDASVELSFEKGGRITSTPVEVGTRVRAGDTLLAVDTKELEALRAQAKANLDYELARLVEINTGARREDVEVSRARVSSARGVVVDAEAALRDKVGNALTVADDGIFNHTDQFFDNPRTINLRLTLPLADQKLITTLEGARRELTERIAMLSREGEIEALLNSTKTYLDVVAQYFDDLASGVNALTPSSQYPLATIDGWKTDVSLARTNLKTAVSALLASEQVYRTQRSALMIAENELALKVAPPTPESLATQEAKIVASRAALRNLDAQIAKSTLVAPFDAVVTKQDGKRGEIASPNAPLVSLMGDNGFKVTMNVPEVDVAKLSVGDEARITLDAYGSDVVFLATLSMIDPAETILEGVSTYKVTLRFNEQDERIRSGMTANVDVSTDRREGVLFIPMRAVTTKDGKKIVRVPDGALEREVEVTLGLRGSDGTVEVLSGLTEGQTIITFSAK